MKSLAQYLNNINQNCLLKNSHKPNQKQILNSYIMKAIFTIAIVTFLNTCAATFAFANNGNPTKGAPATTVATVATVVTLENNDATAEMSAAMDAVLGNLITNNTLATTATTMDNAAIMTITANNETTISNRFAVHTFGETTTSDNIAPVAAAMEVITLDAEEL
jgi:hypothetical protein